MWLHNSSSSDKYSIVIKNHTIALATTYHLGFGLESKDLNIDKKDDVASNGVKKTTSLDPRDELKNTIKQEIDKMKKMTNPTDDIKTAIKDLIKSLET